MIFALVWISCAILSMLNFVLIARRDLKKDRKEKIDREDIRIVIYISTLFGPMAFVMTLIIVVYGVVEDCLRKLTSDNGALFKIAKKLLGKNYSVNDEGNIMYDPENMYNKDERAN